MNKKIALLYYKTDCVLKRLKGGGQMKHLIIVLLLLFSSELWGTTYYIDYNGGDDSNTGKSVSNAWKHAPGDDNAKGTSSSVKLQPGDAVLFKGGVIYRGSLVLNANGAAGNPITYKGDGWGTEKAIIDGAEEFKGTWTQCSSALECGDNPNFGKIYYADAPANYDFFTRIYEDGEFLWYSQDPNPRDPFYHDRIREYHVIPQKSSSITQTRTSLTDPVYFTQNDSYYWDGAYIITWRKPNVTATKAITGYNPATHTITYADLGGDVYKERDSYYALLNHIALIDRPGEYFFDDKSNKIYVWPLDSDDPANHVFSVLTRETGITYTGRAHVVIEGFVVRNSIRGIIGANGTAEDIVIKNNEVTKLSSGNSYAVQISGKDIVVEDNRVTDAHRGVGILAAGTNITVRNNLVKRTSRQGIWFMGVTHGLIVNNTVVDIRGTHSNGISVYLYNKDILIAHNQVWNAGSSLTYHGNNDPGLIVNLVIYNNFIENATNSWGNVMNKVTILNNYFGGAVKTADDKDVTFINNIVRGGGRGDIRSHNIYTGLMRSQAEEYGESLAEGEIREEDLSKIIADAATQNYHLKYGSIAVDAGIDVTQYLPIKLFPEYDFNVDLDGNPRKVGAAWDIGPYEFDPSLDK